MFDPMSVKFPSCSDAVVAVNELRYIIDEKGYITVRDWKEQGESVDPITTEDVEFGWRSIDGAKVCPIGWDKFYIRLPSPEPLANIYKGGV